MELITLIIQMLEKVSVLVATALVLVLLRPAEVWLTETGQRASLRRRLVMILVFAPLAVWGIFLGFEIGGMTFNVRAVGIIVAGYLGGVRVGAIVGLISGLVYAAMAPEGLVGWVLIASIIDGVVAGLWARRFGTGPRAVIVGALLAQLVHHAAPGLVFFAVDPATALSIASNIELHVAKIGATTIGVALFMGLLGLVRERERALADARHSQAAARDAQLEALQYQLRPHFLFNLLNTLAYLIRTDPTRARETTLDLAEFLRYTLTRADAETTLREEIRQIARYVDLERARFGEGLRFSFECADEALPDALRLPPLILQPLVENAIQHGATEERVCVEIIAARDDDGLITVRVLDDGPGPPPEDADAPARRHQSVGLHNVRARLERFFHGRAHLTLSARDGGGACAALHIPDGAWLAPPASLGERAREQLRKVALPAP